MSALASDLDTITHILGEYFLGLHEGDSERLRAIFHPQAALQAPGLRRSRAEWLALVEERESPAARGDTFAYRILGIEILGDQAMAKVDCPLLGRRYVDYLGLLREDGRWRIVNKMYADRPE